MGFMQKQITAKQKWYRVETSQGTQTVPMELIGPEPADSLAFDSYVEGGYESVESWELVEGYGARLSAPGYLDCTEWTVFDTVAEAEKYLEEMYGDDQESETDDSE